MSEVRVDIEWSGRRVAQTLRGVAADSLLVGAEFVLGESNDATPLDEGTLVNSGVASVDEVKLQAAVSYDTPYAVRQHEDMTARHAPGRHAKYLELALVRNRTKVGKLIGAQFSRRLAALGDAEEPS